MCTVMYMPSVRAEDRRSRLRWYTRARNIVGLALVVLLLLLTVDLLGGPSIRVGAAMLALPALAAVFAGPRAVLVVALATLPAYVGVLAANGRLTWEDAPVSIATAVLISVAAAGAGAARERRERELAQSRRVTAQTQQIMLRPLPQRLGPLELSSVYLASDDESTIGGDLYACALVDGRPRVIVADVQGKGMSTVEVVTFLLVAFRRAAQQHVALADLPGYLDDSILDDLGYEWEAVKENGEVPQESAMEQRFRECFVTAVIVETDADGDKVYGANCGHPSPLLVRDGDARELQASAPALPIGLLRFDRNPVHIDVHSFAAEDTLLLFTDGLIEARNEAGEFFPILSGIEEWGGYAPDAMLEAVTTGLRRHAGANLVDDVAMVAVHRSPPEPVRPTGYG